MARYLHAPRLRERQLLRNAVLPTFAALGQTVIFGGMPRDIARRGGKGFSSDVDLVVDPQDYGRFRDLMVELGGVENRFGGFAARMHGWRVDVWALQDTWARRTGLRRVEEITDILDTTFFDFDSVMYNISTGRVAASKNYFTLISESVLGLNLIENPNPMGSALRALRRALLWDVHLSDKLADYVLDSIDTYGWERLVELDTRAFRNAVLAYEERDRVVTGLLARLRVGNGWAAQRLSSTPEQLGFDEAL